MEPWPAKAPPSVPQSSTPRKQAQQSKQRRHSSVTSPAGNDQQPPTKQARLSPAMPSTSGVGVSHTHANVAPAPPSPAPTPPPVASPHVNTSPAPPPKEGVPPSNGKKSHSSNKKVTPIKKSARLANKVGKASHVAARAKHKATKNMNGRQAKATVSQHGISAEVKAAGDALDKALETGFQELNAGLDRLVPDVSQDEQSL